MDMQFVAPAFFSKLRQTPKIGSLQVGTEYDEDTGRNGTFRLLGATRKMLKSESLNVFL